MRRYFFPFLLLIAATGSVLFIPVTEKKGITVPFSLYRTGEQLTNIQKVKKWYSPFLVDVGTELVDSSRYKKLQSGAYSLTLENSSSLSTTIHSSKGSKSGSFLFSVVSDSGKVQESVVQLRYKTTLVRKWFGKTELEKQAERSLQNLYDYMTDTKKFYGFEIQEVKVEDTAFLFSRATVKLADKQKGLIALFDKLIAFAKQKDAGYNGTRIFYSMASGDEITLFVSIGVTKDISAAVTEGIEYKRMPYGKNLLATTYQGPLKESYKAFEALELFKADQLLTSMAIPYQKILSDGYNFSDDQMVQLKVYYPVF